MGRAVAILLIFSFHGYFHTAQPVIIYTLLDEVKAKLEAVPQDHPLPIILYEKLSRDPLPRFNGPLVRCERGNNGFGVHIVFRRSDLTFDLLSENSEYLDYLAKDEHLVEKYQKATEISDKLTRWVRGGRGWTAGPKPDIAVHDILIGFEPEWKRKPLTPELVRKF